MSVETTRLYEEAKASKSFFTQGISSKKYRKYLLQVAAEDEEKILTQISIEGCTKKLIKRLNMIEVEIKNLQ